QSIMTWQDFFAAKLRAMGITPADEAQTVSPLVPNVDLPVSEAVVYRTVSISSLPAVPRLPVELEGALDLLAAAPSDGAHGLAEGVLLTHEQAWRMKGVTLGKLLHSLSLAPGEVTQVAMTNWERATTARGAEDIDVQEDAS